MTIAQDIAAGSDARTPAADADRTARAAGSSVPLELRLDRLDRQIASFVRAGYRLETRAGLQAIVVRRVQDRPRRGTALAVLTLGASRVVAALVGGRRLHRVVVTVDGAGRVRLA